VFLCNSCKIRSGFVIKVYLYIVVQTQHIGVQWSAGYKIVLSLAHFKLEILDDLWITNKNKKNSK